MPNFEFNRSANFNGRADVLTRNDMFCLSCKRVGSGDRGLSYALHYYYAGGVPTRLQLQEAVNRDLGPQVVIDPATVLVGESSCTVKAFSSTLKDQDAPARYVANLTQAVAEQPKDVLVEHGDIIRFFQGSVAEGQVIGQAGDGSSFTVRVGSLITKVAAEDVVEVKSPEFFPTDKAAYEYFLQLYPQSYTKALTNNDPKKSFEVKFPVKPVWTKKKSEEK